MSRVPFVRVDDCRARDSRPARRTGNYLPEVRPVVDGAGSAREAIQGGLTADNGIIDARIPMANTESPPPSGRNRRSTVRVPLALRVRVNSFTEGYLIDLSEGGALLRLPRAQQANRQVTLTVEGQSETVHLAATVVRSSAVTVEGAAPARTEYDVAIQFLDFGADTAAMVRRVVHAHRVQGA